MPRGQFSDVFVFLFLASLSPRCSRADISGVCAKLKVPMDEVDLGRVGSVCVVKQKESPTSTKGIREAIECDQSDMNPGQFAQTETCPTAYGTCESGICQPIKDGWYKDTFGRDWEGIGTFPYATVTYYGGSTGCGSWNMADGSNDVDALVKCMKNAHIEGVMAVPHLMAGDRGGSSQACYKNNDLCYYITGPKGSVVSSIFDHCGGFVQCTGGSPPSQRGMLNLSPSVSPDVIYTDANQCLSLGKKIAAGVMPQCRVQGVPDGTAGTGCCTSICANTLNVDWCGSNDHPHFDMDQKSAAKVCPDVITYGSCVLSKVEPMLCPVPQPEAPYCCKSGACDNCLDMSTDSGCMSDESNCVSCGGKWCVVDPNYNLCDLSSPLPTVNPVKPCKGDECPSPEPTTSTETTTPAAGSSVSSETTSTSGVAPVPPFTGGGFTGQGTTTTTTTQKPFPIGAVIGAVAGVAALAAAAVAYTMLQGPPAQPVFEFEGEEAMPRGEAQREAQVAMGEADFA